MRKANLYRYQLEMDSGVILREQKLTQREGWVVELTEDNRTGYGEVAPLVGFSHESMDQAFVEVVSRLEKWVSGQDLDCHSSYPSVAFGLSMAEYELKGLLGAEGNYQAALLCNGDPDDLIPALNAMQGDKVAKIKVGLHEPIRDGILVDLFLETTPDLQLRLDANRAWTLDKAKQFAKKIKPSQRSRIQYIEEPCRAPGDSLTFAIETGIAIGWDETLQNGVMNPDFNLEFLTGAKAIVIKPTLIGHIERCIQLIEKAQVLGLVAVISSSIESSLGLSQLARFAHQFTPMTVPGLDTLQLFKEQLHTPWPNSELPLRSLSSQTLVWHQSSE
ncbi:o-succinylbenzoate synthase [Vibrio sp. UCD-FRSSP16_10]|uniref:o-succinylbenzoate synthase n=1 Tax=unclassified Vibrio TaxID=2614977 RepID=UPI0007FF06E0|nr:MULTISPECIES: o-succinylbenzoate synthase [unclassified Vibrio]OBT16037.1 o-succinylbenzoate synthase [Vibrio sp. UCD-FRSSP16_30]OBT21119.1 o-succinylbenzoate synthase [Vibrio sp. UCD-FRSSP16_10]